MGKTIDPYIAARRVEEEPAVVIPPAIPKPEAVRRIVTANLFIPATPFTRPPSSMLINVGTSPTLILKPPHIYPYLLFNPSPVVGLTTSHKLVDNLTVTGPGNTQATPLGVANYLQAHMHLVVTAVTGTWQIVAQSREPFTGNWADSQVVFGDINATGIYYVSIGSFGLVIDFATRWFSTVAGSMTFTLTITLKDAIRGEAAGLARTIYIGGKDVAVGTGLPLLEGADRLVYLGPDVSLYAIAGVVTPIRVFSL